MKLSNSQLNKLKSATKYATKVTLRLSRNFIGTNVNNFPHNLDSQIDSLCKAFANNSSMNIQSSKTQLPKVIHLKRISW